MTETNKEKWSWRRIALPISIVLNLFLVAVIVGHMLHARSRVIVTGGPLARALANAEAILPAPDAAKFGAVIRREAPLYRKAAEQLGEAREELDRQILAEQFDPEGMRRALAAWGMAWNHFLDEFGGPLAEALGDISLEGRRKLVNERRAERVKPSLP